MTISKEQCIEHLRNREYMSGVDREKSRVKSTGEVFTPTELVNIVLDLMLLEKPNIFSSANEAFLDPTCGDGQFLAEAVIRKREHMDYVQCLNSTFGADLMPDNCIECIRRLYICDYENIIALNIDSIKAKYPNYYWADGLKEVYEVNTKYYTGIANIVCADGLVYDFSFGEEHILEVDDLRKIPRAKKSKKSKEKELKPVDNIIC